MCASACSRAHIVATPPQDAWFLGAATQTGNAPWEASALRTHPPAGVRGVEQITWQANHPTVKLVPTSAALMGPAAEGASLAVYASGACLGRWALLMSVWSRNLDQTKSYWLTYCAPVGRFVL